MTDPLPLLDRVVELEKHVLQLQQVVANLHAQNALMASHCHNASGDVVVPLKQI